MWFHYISVSGRLRLGTSVCTTFHTLVPLRSMGYRYPFPAGLPRAAPLSVGPTTARATETNFSQKTEDVAQRGRAHFSETCSLERRHVEGVWTTELCTCRPCPPSSPSSSLLFSFSSSARSSSLPSFSSTFSFLLGDIKSDDTGVEVGRHERTWLGI